MDAYESLEPVTYYGEEGKGKKLKSLPLICFRPLLGDIGPLAGPSKSVTLIRSKSKKTKNRLLESL